MQSVEHWVAGRATPGTSGRSAPVFDPALGVQTKTVSLASAAEVDDAVRCAVDAAAQLAGVAAGAAHRQDVPAARAHRGAPPGSGAARQPGARQGRDRCRRRGGARARVRRVRLWSSADAEGLPQLGGVQRGRRPHRAPPGRGGRRYHPVQLPGHGAAVDDGERSGLWQRLHLEAVREGSLSLHAARRVGAGGRVPRRCLQRAAG